MNAAAPAPGLLLLAAGAATRFGSPKQLARIQGQTLVRRAARAACDSGARVVVVTGAYAGEVQAALQGLDLQCAYNPSWEQGMGGSIACGLRCLLGQAAAPAVIVALADQVQVGAAQFERLLQAHRSAPDRIVVAERGDGIGPPCLFPAEYFTRLAALQGPQGAREILRAHRQHLLRLAMPEAAMDVDTPDDLARALQSAARG